MRYIIVIIFAAVSNLLPAQVFIDSTYTTETIEVDAVEGTKGITPVTIENVERDEIVERNWVQDLPMFLNTYTSINSYSESGASVGYSYLSIRGFDQRRISVLMNGSPQNDPEDHQIYWVDLSDITSSLESIQIQRGVGNALYGSSSIGGVINIETVNPFKNKFLTLKAGYGSFNTRRYTFEYSSGEVGNGLAFYGKFSKLNTDGYRDLSWSDHWSYFLSAGKNFGKSILRFNAYGGPIKNHLAYLGVTKDYLTGNVTGNEREDRKENFLSFPDESDNYNQPHYEILFSHQLNEKVSFSSTLSYIRGEGFFVTNFPTFYGLDFSYFRLQPFFVSDSTLYNSAYYRRNSDGSLYFEPGNGYQIITSDIKTNLWVNNKTYGFFPKLQVLHMQNKGRLIIGGEFRHHTSEHYGEVTFGDALPPGTQSGHQYYFYNGGKRTYSGYVNELLDISKKATLMAGVQFTYHKYIIEKDKFKPYGFDTDYSFFSPRVGATYRLSPNTSTFINLSFAEREPRLKDIYDGENPFSKPNFQNINTVNGIYEDALVKPERIFDVEAGATLNITNLSADFNLYYMFFNDEIVNNGQLDNVGQPISGNAGKSVHRGIEIQLNYNPVNQLSFYGNLNLSKNYFLEYIEKSGIDSLGNIIYGNDYSGNKILLNPQIIANAILEYKPFEHASIFAELKHTGKQYLDNSENERKNPSLRSIPGYVDKLIEPYTIINAGVTINSKIVKQLPVNMEFSFRVNNVFDSLYETSGSVDAFGTAYWIPAAERNIFADIKISF